MSARIVSLILCSIVAIQSAEALVYPSATPTGETPGGTYRTYFDNMFSSEIDCYGSGKVVGGFNSVGLPFCVVPAPTGLNILGSQTGDTLRYNGTDWVRNNLLFNNGTAIGIGMQTPSYILDVVGTANFTALRMPTGAASGRILVSDGAGNFAWSDYSSGSTASGIVGGTENIIPKFGTLGMGLISSQIFDNGTEMGIGTSTPTAGYKVDISGADILINTIRVGRGGGNILSNIALGWNALGTNATATTSSALGYGALSSLNSGAGNVALGNLAGSTLTSGSNNIFIGNAVQPSGITTSNELNIGNWIYGSGGNIGIGIVNPGAKLEINGQIKITGGSPSVGKFLMSDASGLATWENVSASSISATGVINGPEYYIPKFGQYGSGLYQSSLYELPSGFIGVGNTNPTADLDISGNLRIRSGASLGYIFQSDATGIGRWVPASAASNAWLLTGNAGTTPGTNFIGTTDAQDFVIMTNSGERMRVLSTGNVGIGTTNPQRKFVVQDDNSGTPSSVVIYNANTTNTNGANLSFRTDTIGAGASNFVDSAGIQAVYDDHNHATRRSQIRIYTMSGAQMNFGLHQNYEGNIGIGTSTPGFRLDVAGTGNFSGFRLPSGAGVGRFLVSDALGNASWQNTTSTLSGTYWSLSGNTVGSNDFLGSTNAQDLRIRVNNTQIARFYTGGSVSIGTGNSLSSPLGVYVMGISNTITGSTLSVIGNNNSINNGIFDGIVLGNSNTMAAGGWPIILGRLNSSPSTYDSPILVGLQNTASYHNAILIGMFNTGGGESAQPSLAVGAYNQAGDVFIGYREEVSAVGMRNRVLAQYSSAFGRSNTINASNSSVFGSNISNSIAGSTQIGPNNTAKVTIFTGGQVAIGTSVITTGATLKVAGQIEITGGSPGIGRILVSDATGLASWQNTTSTLSGTYWSLSGNTVGSNDFLGSTNAQDLIFRTNNTEKLRLLASMNVSGQILTLTGGDMLIHSLTLGRGGGSISSNTVFGENALRSNTFGIGNLAFGVNSLSLNTLGSGNTAVGRNALMANITGSLNVALGSNALADNISGTNNTALGTTSLYNLTTGAQNTAVGNNSMLNSVSGSENVALGAYSLAFALGGNRNTSVGYSAGQATTGAISSNNSFLGYRAGVSITTGSDNVGLGYEAGSAIMAGSGNILLGFQSAPNLISGSRNIVIGYNINSPTATANNTLNVGNLLFGTGLSATGSTISSGNIGIGTSTPTAKLEIAGDVRITGGSPGAGKFLVSDATGLASWQNTTTTLSGSYWALIGNNLGASDFIGSLNAQDLRFRTNNTQRMVITSAGNVGIGVANPTTANLELSGSALISGDLTVQGRVITDTIVNRTITNVSVSGNLLPDSNAPLAVRNLGSTAQRWNNLFLSGQISIGGGSPALNRVLVSDATGLGTWSSVFSGTTLASAVSGGSSGYISVFGNGGIGLNNSRIFQTGSFIGIGTTTPGYSLDVSGTGNFIGLRIPTGASNNFILTSDASGNARWASGFSGSYSASGITGGVQNNVPKFGTGGSGLITSQIYDNGTVVGIGTGSANGAKVVIDSGVDDDTGLRFARIDINSALQANNVIALGVNASGKVLPISPISNIAVYTGVLRTTVMSPNPDLNTFNITYDFNRYFGIPGKQSFVVSQGNGPSYNGPYYRENGTSSVCSWNGTYGTSPYDCATAGPDGLSASPNNSFTMTAKGDTFGYQIALGARGDAALFARSGRFNGSQTGGLYTNDSPYQTPAPWNKIVTVPVNHPEYLFINTGLNSQLQAIPGGGNVGIGTSAPESRFEVWSGATSETLLHMRGTNNVGIGLGAINEDLTGNANVGIGAESLYILSSGYSNTAVGYRSLRQTQAGFNNSVLGQEASYNNNGGSWNSAFGYQALYSSTSGTGNIAIGPRALYNLSTGHNNIAIGFEALRVIAGSAVGQNIGIGHQALYSTTASQLTAVGHRALYTNSSGLRNTAFGFQALYDMSTQSDSTAIGYDALTNATGLGNTALGSMAGDNITTGTNNIVIGANIDAQVATASNQLNIGNWIYGSGGNIGIGATDPDARLEVNGQIKITGGTPAAGRVLTSDANGLATWQTPSGGGGGGGWSLTGDAGTVPGTNFIGTTDAVDFLIYTNGTEKVRIESGGDVGIGTNNPTSKLDVNGTVELGTNGTQLNGIIRATVNRDLPSIASNGCSAQTFTVTNALTTGTAMVSPANALTNRLYIAYARVSAANTVEVNFCNESGSAINMTAMDFHLTVIQ